MTPSEHTSGASGARPRTTAPPASEHPFELVGRVGLDVTSLRDIVPAGTKAVRYAVVAVSEKGNVVGQSRVQKIVLRIDDNEQDVRPTEVDVQPVRAAAKAAWPLDVR